MKKIAILPTLLTLGNGVCGFASIAYASKIVPQTLPYTTNIDPAAYEAHQNFYFVLSACLILAAMVFDALDGYAARLSKTASDFGAQLDSLCDVISFGAAPGFLLLRLGLDWQRPLVRQAVAVIAALYVVCTILRLARFNVETSPDPNAHKRFKGLPSPAAAGCIASLAILRCGLPYTFSVHNGTVVAPFLHVWVPLGALFVSLLMVSRLSYPHFARMLRGRRSFSFIVEVVLVVFVIGLVPDLAFFLLFWGYALSGPVRYAMRRLTGHAVPSHRPSLD